MSTITKSLSGFIFNGAALALASAPWKDKVRAIYGFNASGSGYQVFKPASAFNSLTQLSPDGVCILDAATPGFELPGATLTAASPAPVAAPVYFAVNKLETSSPAPGQLRLAINYTYLSRLECGVLLDGQFYNGVLSDVVGDAPAGQDAVSLFTDLAPGAHSGNISLKVSEGYNIFTQAFYVVVG